ncbi:COG1361 S-layer family protein [Halodesulfurarchaeum sp.]|uniref:COG1361 S-layer family protein n=1 Tax=Halodesulfurarchaeum sp. TaxID=1980530 RepID=UPI002FC379FE
MKRPILLVTALLVVGTLLAPTVVLAAEDPRFETEVPEPTVSPGQTTQVAVEFTNTAEDIDDEVETATDVEVTMKEGDTPFAVRSGTHRLGTLADEQVKTDQFTIRVPQNIDPGTYHIPIQLEYVYDEDEEESTTVSAEVRVEDRAMFSVRNVEADLTVGETGSVTMTLENNGTENATDATVSLQSETDNVVFGSSPSTVAYVGEWQADKQKEITVDARAPDTADAGTYSIATSVNYQDTDGYAQTSMPLTAGVTVQPEIDQFSLSDSTHSLRVGEEGTLSMTLTNDGAAVTDTVVELTSTGTNIHPLANEYAIGAMDTGESTAVSFPIEISESAEATPQQFSFSVSYEDSEGDDRVSDPLNVQADIEPDRDRFDVTPVNVTVRAGSSDTITVEVTNNGDSPVTDVNAKIFTNDPLSSGDDEAYIESLDPGETDEITFGVAAAGTANVKTYPLSLDFQYDSNGDSKLSKTYQVPIDVTEPESSGPSPYLLGGVIAVLLVIIGAVLYSRR